MHKKNARECGWVVLRATYNARGTKFVNRIPKVENKSEINTFTAVCELYDKRNTVSAHASYVCKTTN